MARLVVMLVGLAAAGTYSNSLGAASTDAPPAPVVAPATLLDGRIEAASGTRRLAFGRLGRVARVEVKRGERVRRNQVLAALHCGDAKADLAMAEAELELLQLDVARRLQGPEPLDLAIAQERLALAQVELNTAEAVRERHESLFRKNGMVSKQEMESAVRNSMAARLNVSMAQNALDRLQRKATVEEERENAAREKIRLASIARAQYQLSLCEIVSPVDGLVVDLSLGPGEMAGPSSGFIDVVDDSKKLVSVCVPGSAVSRIKAGQKVRVGMPAHDGKSIEGVVARIEPLVTKADGPHEVGECGNSCAMRAWIEPAERLPAVPLHSAAYIQLP